MKKAIVILGGGINENGTLPEEAMKRVKKGAKLYSKGAALIMSGKWSFLAEKTFPKSEAAAMKEYALSLGVREEDIFVESESQDTLGNAYFVKKMIDAQGFGQFIVITSKFHEKRASFIFEQAFGRKIDLATTPTSGKEVEEQALLEFTKKIVRGKKFSQVIEEDHPVYGTNPKFSKKEFFSLINCKS